MSGTEERSELRLDEQVCFALGPAAGGGFELSGIDITLRAKVDGIDAGKFAELARTAEQSCPVSKALPGTTITLDAALEN